MATESRQPAERPVRDSLRTLAWGRHTGDRDRLQQAVKVLDQEGEAHHGAAARAALAEAGRG